MSSRRRKPLYPNAWGSGTKPFEGSGRIKGKIVGI
tara:strand:+ start:2916 stop:3020 length:105 start_codon:yes stop_codon:yes gene_type:complete